MEWVNDMHFRKAVGGDADRIMEIIRQAQRYFRENGIDQWQNGYPNPDVVMNDIKNENNYVLLKCGSIIATAVVSFDGEETYGSIYEGNWAGSGSYAVIHRIAVEQSMKGSGIAAVMMGNIETLCRKAGMQSIRVDTHRDNRSMQRMLSKNGFQYCGIIYLKDGSERLAFEKLITADAGP